MAYQKSPRPDFNEPSAIHYPDITRYMWGDPEAGEVADWIYVSSGKLHQLVFGMAPGKAFRHSESYRTIFAADELYIVLEGTLVLNNPQTGEVCRAEPGETVFFRRDTWHHGYSFGTAPLRVLEYFAPPPSQGTAGTYAQAQADLPQVRTSQDQWLSKWPMQRAEADRATSMHHICRRQALARLEGGLLVELFISTQHISVGAATLLPGQSSDIRAHGGDLGLYVAEGQLLACAPAAEGREMFELNPRDGFFLPAGVSRQFFNYGETPARWYFGVAPGYAAVAP